MSTIVLLNLILGFFLITVFFAKIRRIKGILLWNEEEQCVDFWWFIDTLNFTYFLQKITKITRQSRNTHKAKILRINIINTMECRSLGMGNVKKYGHVVNLWSNQWDTNTERASLYGWLEARGNYSPVFYIRWLILRALLLTPFIFNVERPISTKCVMPRWRITSFVPNLENLFNIFSAHLLNKIYLTFCIWQLFLQSLFSL